MDWTLDQSIYQEVPHDPYDGSGFAIELTERLLSRTPSQTSAAKISFRSSRSLLSRIKPAFDVDGESADQTGTPLVNTTDSKDTSGKQKPERNRWFKGIRLAALSASLVLLLNVVFAIAMAALHRTVLYEGSCDYVGRTTIGLHLLINVLASVLLSASNHTMQILAAPTREEVDYAHSKGKHMDIGILSLRNLNMIRPQRAAACLILAMSSLPIHLLYNSTVFRTVTLEMYSAVVANTQWITGADFSTENIVDLSNNDLSFPRRDLMTLQRIYADPLAESSHRVRRLSNAECIHTFSQTWLSGYENVVAVTNAPSEPSNQTVLAALWYRYGSSGGWICGLSDCDPPKTDPSTWTIVGHKIDYCLALVRPEHCRIRATIPTLAAVIFCNILKVAVIFWTIWKHKKATFVTLGDAISSYLDNPDPTTKDKCLMSRSALKEWKSARSPVEMGRLGSSRWLAGPSLMLRVVTFGYYTAVITAATAGLAAVLSSPDRNPGIAPWSIGFGELTDKNFLYNFFRPVLTTAILANLPQIAVSFLFLSINSLLTSMLLAKEWSMFAMKRKALRVTSPKGSQRSTHFLQLPWRYSGPFLVVFTSLHWVTSQGFFFAAVEEVDSAPDYPSEWSSALLPPAASNSTTTSLYFYLAVSAPALLTNVVVLVGLLITILALGFRKLKGPMPLVGSCSVAITAACHAPEDDIDAARLLVQWGESLETRGKEIGHCTFTSQKVYAPIPGRKYAGWRDASSGEEEPPRG